MRKQHQPTVGAKYVCFVETKVIILNIGLENTLETVSSVGEMRDESCEAQFQLKLNIGQIFAFLCKPHHFNNRLQL